MKVNERSEMFTAGETVEILDNVMAVDLLNAEPRWIPATVLDEVETPHGVQRSRADRILVHVPTYAKQDPRFAFVSRGPAHIRKAV
jgi:hypothetical protein